MTGLEMTHVPYRGMTDGLMTDLMTGRVDLMFNTTGSLLQPVKSGQLRGLAVTTATRFPGAPELRTVVECGVSGYDVSSWYALYAPAKTPADVIKKINADMVAITGRSGGRSRSSNRSACWRKARPPNSWPPRTQTT